MRPPSSRASSLSSAAAVTANDACFAFSNDPVGRVLLSSTSQLNLRTFGNTSLTLELD
jgi:hypothetical protein